MQHLIGAAKGEGQKSAPCTRRDAPRGSSVDRDAVGGGPTALQDVEDSVSVGVRQAERVTHAELR